MTEPDYFGDYWRARLNRAETEHQQELNRMAQQLNACRAQREREILSRDEAIQRAERAERERDAWRVNYERADGIERERDYWRNKYETLSNEIGATDNE